MSNLSNIRHIELWKTDYANMSIFDREFNTFANRSNEHPILRNTPIETHLFGIDDTPNHDTITTKESLQLKKGQYKSNQQLYRMFHTQEVNSPCYPNIDQNAWNNTTKASYQTKDTRDQFNLHEQ